MDVLITSSSRPECLKRTVKSFLDKATYSGCFRFIIHEDCVFPAMSRKIKDLVKTFSGNVIYAEDNPPIGLMRSILNMLTQVRGPIFFYLQDDWEFERTFPVDDMLSIMRNNAGANPRIDQLILSGYRLSDGVRMVKGREVPIEYKEVKVYSSHSGTAYVIRKNWRWGAGIGLWRTDWARRLPGAARFAEIAYEIRSQHNTYVWGPKEDWRYVMHLGGFLKMLSLENDLPGTGRASLEGAAMLDSKHKAPWILRRRRPTKQAWMKAYKSALQKDGCYNHRVQ